MHRSKLMCVIGKMAVVLAGAPTVHAQCGEWTNRFDTNWHPGSEVRSLCTWDSDGPGPMPRDIVAGASFADEQGATTHGAFHWDGVAWQAIGAPSGGPVNTVIAWQPSQWELCSDQLVAAGHFHYIGGIYANNIAVWDGSRWCPLGNGTNGAVTALTAWDPDGSGGRGPEVVVGGAFSCASDVEARRIAAWDGAHWRALGSEDDGYFNSINVLHSWDPDGDGPEIAQLIAAGLFRSPTTFYEFIARWDGEAWRPLGAGLSGFVYALTDWDPDGAGPMPAELIAGGEFDGSGLARFERVARWDGQSWRGFGLRYEPHTRVRALATYDANRDDSTPAFLIAAGNFQYAGRWPSAGIAQWDTIEWLPLESGTNRVVNALTTLPPAGSSQRSDTLFVGGAFSLAGGVPVNSIAEWSGTPRPAVLTPPTDRTALVGGEATFDVVALGARLSYQWRRNGSALADGVTPAGAVIVGASTPRLTINNLHAHDAGLYDCLISNDCETLQLPGVTLTVPDSACRGDVLGDRAVGFDDLALIITNWALPIPPGIPSADVDGSGDIGLSDVSVVLANWGAVCP